MAFKCLKVTLVEWKTFELNKSWPMGSIVFLLPVCECACVCLMAGNWLKISEAQVTFLIKKKVTRNGMIFHYGEKYTHTHTRTSHWMIMMIVIIDKMCVFMTFCFLWRTVTTNSNRSHLSILLSLSVSLVNFVAFLLSKMNFLAETKSHFQQ